MFWLKIEKSNYSTIGILSNWTYNIFILEQSSEENNRNIRNQNSYLNDHMQTFDCQYKNWSK